VRSCECAFALFVHTDEVVGGLCEGGGRRLQMGFLRAEQRAEDWFEKKKEEIRCCFNSCFVMFESAACLLESQK